MAGHAGERSGIGGGTMNFAGNLGGLVSPTLTPWLAGRIGWEAALTATAALAVASGLLWLGVRLDDAAVHRAATAGPSAT
jgi:ACS family glucarate transporter-like MFS transporter